MALGGARGLALPAGHSVRVSMALLLPDSYHNREVGMFQVYNCIIYYSIPNPNFLELNNSYDDLLLMVSLSSAD
jgi:hypothetical protein